MNEVETIQTENAGAIKKLPLLAAFVAIIGLADSIYLAVHHYTAEPVPCSIISGCETVLTSAYAEVMGVPLAALGAAAYFAAFSFALLAAFGNRLMWTLFGILAVLMAIYTAWLIYVQAFLIGAFCQFCLISALTTFSLLTVFLVSRLRRRD